MIIKLSAMGFEKYDHDGARLCFGVRVGRMRAVFDYVWASGLALDIDFLVDCALLELLLFISDWLRCRLLFFLNLRVLSLNSR